MSTDLRIAARRKATNSVLELTDGRGPECSNETATPVALADVVLRMTIPCRRVGRSGSTSITSTRTGRVRTTICACCVRPATWASRTSSYHTAVWKFCGLSDELHATFRRRFTTGLKKSSRSNNGLADRFTPERRSEIMTKIRSTGTAPEKKLERLLSSLGYRYETHVTDIPGTPDAVLRRKKVAFFVNGCFWHAHRGCARATIPKTNRLFWLKKIRRNTQRDRGVRRALRGMGWSVVTLWTCGKISSEVVLSRLLRITRRRQSHAKKAEKHRSADTRGRR